jgi:hypothetical protein
VALHETIYVIADVYHCTSLNPPTVAIRICWMFRRPASRTPRILRFDRITWGGSNVIHGALLERCTPKGTNNCQGILYSAHLTNGAEQ